MCTRGWPGQTLGTDRVALRYCNTGWVSACTGTGRRPTLTPWHTARTFGVFGSGRVLMAEWCPAAATGRAVVDLCRAADVSRAPRLGRQEDVLYAVAVTETVGWAPSGDDWAVRLG